MSEVAMNEVIMKRRKIRKEIDSIKAQKNDAMRRLQGREFVHRKQITARRRLLNDLNARLKILEAEYEALEDGPLDE